ncbi:hypothetical protein Leryth_002154 [Lithospermum erythrorhizon]|nr:hypothetical protein Leryth_002154 [Lithospermum erythrorhizon]
MKLFLQNARAITLMLVLVVMSSSLVHEGNAQGRACGSTFFSALVQMIPCRDAVAPFSTAPPSIACCAAIRALGQPCLCILVNGPPIAGVDRGMAMQLPQRCAANFEPCGIMGK